MKISKQFHADVQKMVAPIAQASARPFQQLCLLYLIRMNSISQDEHDPSNSKVRLMAQSTFRVDCFQDFCDLVEAFGVEIDQCYFTRMGEDQGSAGWEMEVSGKPSDARKVYNHFLKEPLKHDLEDPKDRDRDAVDHTFHIEARQVLPRDAGGLSWFFSVVSQVGACADTQRPNGSRVTDQGLLNSVILTKCQSYVRQDDARVIETRFCATSRRAGELLQSHFRKINDGLKTRYKKSGASQEWIKQHCSFESWPVTMHVIH